MSEKTKMKNHRMPALGAGLLVAAIASVCLVLPAAAGFKADRTAAVPSIHRPARVGVAAAPTSQFRSRLAAPKSAQTSAFRAHLRAVATSD